MAGSISFKDGGWDYDSSTIFYVFQQLIARLPEGQAKDDIQERMDSNVPLLDLSHPDQRRIVDVIVNDMPEVVSRLESTVRVLQELIDLARQQQAYNRAAIGADSDTDYPPSEPSIVFDNSRFRTSGPLFEYVVYYLASRLPEGAVRDNLMFKLNQHIAHLDLRGLKNSGLVDMIADDLPGHVETSARPDIREHTKSRLSPLFDLAREQQRYNATLQDGSS